MLMLTMAMLVGLILPLNLSAKKGLLSPEAENHSNNSMFGRGGGQNGMEWSGGGMSLQDPTQPQPVGVGPEIFGDGFDWTGGGMTTQDPTEEAPLGSGLLIMTMAGISYAIIESRKVKPKE